MATYNEIIFAVLDTVRPLNQTGSEITEELVKFHIREVRAQLAKQQIGKSRTLPNQWFQSLGCLDLVQADASDCCDFPTGCILLKSVLEIPQTIDGGVTNLLTRVGPVNITEKPFQYIEFERVPFESGGNRYTRDLIKWFIGPDNNRIYLLIREDNLLSMGIEVIQAHGVFEDPEALVNFRSCTSGTCFSADAPYPIPDSLVPTLIEMVIKRFVVIQASAPIDGSNDGRPNPEPLITK